MRSWIDRLSWYHNFLVSHAFYPVLLSTVLTGGLFLVPAYLGDRLVYRFLPWNLFLAWIPYLSALVAAYLHERYPRYWIYLIVPGGLWFTFFPNAPYLITDLVHLQTHLSITIWQDIVLLVASVWTGLFLAVFSLRTMQGIVQRFTGPIISWLFVALIFVLSGVGVYLGRFFRWNSWDLLFHPTAILVHVHELLATPFDNLRATSFVLQIASFMLVCYLTLTMTYSRRRV